MADREYVADLFGRLELTLGNFQNRQVSLHAVYCASRFCVDLLLPCVSRTSSHT